MKTFTRQFMYENSGCYDIDDLVSCDFMNPYATEISAESILNSSIPLQDKYWFFVFKVFSDAEKQNLWNDFQVLFYNKKPYPLVLRSTQINALHYLDDLFDNANCNDNTLTAIAYYLQRLDMFENSLFEILKKFVDNLK